MGNASSGKVQIMSGKKSDNSKEKCKAVVEVKPKESPKEEPKESPKEKAKEMLKLKLTDSSKSKTYSKAQLEKWTSSINSLLTDEEGMMVFEKFLEEGETEEGEFTKYLDFYRECSNFKKKCIELELEAERIYETYLQPGADLEIGTGDKGKKVGEKLEGEGFPQKSLFDAAQQKVLEKLNEGLFDNFRDYLKEKYKL